MGSGDVEGRFMTWRKSGKSSRLVCSKEIGPSHPTPLFGVELVKTLSPSDRLNRAPATPPWENPPGTLRMRRFRHTRRGRRATNDSRLLYVL